MSNILMTDTTAIVVNVPTVPAFDYGLVGRQVAATLRASAADIKLRIAKTTRDMIDTGRELARAKEHLDHGQFHAWVESEVGIAIRTAQAYMAAAKLADDKGATIAHLPSTTVHRLASKSAPAQVVNEVVARANAGEIVPDRAVVEMIAEAKHQRREADAKARLAMCRSRRSKRQRQEDEKRTQEREQEKAREKERVAKAVAALHDRFGADGIAFILDNLGDNFWPVLEMLRERHRIETANIEVAT